MSDRVTWFRNNKKTGQLETEGHGRDWWTTKCKRPPPKPDQWRRRRNSSNKYLNVSCCYLFLFPLSSGHCHYLSSSNPWMGSLHSFLLLAASRSLKKSVTAVNVKVYTHCWDCKPRKATTETTDTVICTGFCGLSVSFFRRFFFPSIFLFVFFFFFFLFWRTLSGRDT